MYIKIYVILCKMQYLTVITKIHGCKVDYFYLLIGYHTSLVLISCGIFVLKTA